MFNFDDVLFDGQIHQVHVKTVYTLNVLLVVGDCHVDIGRLGRFVARLASGGRRVGLFDGLSRRKRLVLDFGEQYLNAMSLQNELENVRIVEGEYGRGAQFGLFVQVGHREAQRDEQMKHVYFDDVLRVEHRYLVRKHGGKQAHAALSHRLDVFRYAIQRRLFNYVRQQVRLFHRKITKQRLTLVT